MVAGALNRTWNAPLASGVRAARGMHALSDLSRRRRGRGPDLGAVGADARANRGVFFAVSRDRPAAARLQKIHPKYRTPYIPTTLTGFAVGITAALLPIQ